MALLKLGAALATVCVVLPAVGLAVAMVILAAQESWHGGEGAMTTDARLSFLGVALLAMGFAVACAVLLRRSLRRGWIALALVVLGGLVCIVVGANGIIAATGIDGLITALSWGVAATGVVLMLGASLGMASRLTSHPVSR